jgi:hypothetical protein
MWPGSVYQGACVVALLGEIKLLSVREINADHLPVWATGHSS